MATVPSIACLGVIGKNNNPLHITIFPSHPTNTAVRTPLQFSLLLSSTLDIFESRSKSNLTGDYGLLHAIDERLACYGFETNTGVKFVAVVDMRGRVVGEGRGKGLGMREGEMKGVFKSMQAAYVKLLQNPFYSPDEHSGKAAKRIESRRFAEDMKRIGETWTPGGAGL